MADKVLREYRVIVPDTPENRTQLKHIRVKNYAYTYQQVRAMMERCVGVTVTEGWQAHAESVVPTRPEIVTPHPTHQMGPDFCFVCNEGRNKYPEITLSCKGLDIESKAESLSGDGVTKS